MTARALLLLFCLVGTVLAPNAPAGAAAHLAAPAAGSRIGASAVDVQIALDDPGDAVTLRLNGRDIGARLRGTGRARSVVLAGEPGREDGLHHGRNVLQVGDDPPVAFSWRPALGRVHLIVVGNKIDFGAYASLATWQAEVDRIFETLVRPNLVAGRPNLVLLTEDFGLPTAFLGSRGAATRAAKDQDPLAALTNLFLTYMPQANDYAQRYTLPGSGIGPLARALELALTDTLWRAFVPVLQAKAASLGVYLVACTNVAPAQRSTDPAAVAFFGDVDDPARSDVFLPEGIDVYNTAFFWGPDGALLGTVRKVNLTTPERDLLNLSNGRLEDVAVFDTAVGRIGIAISLDAFVDSYVHRLDDLGATLVLQPDANPALWAPPITQAYSEPDGWTASTLGMLRAELPNLTWNATSMMTGNFFPGHLDASGRPTGIVFDGQSTVTRRDRRPPLRGYVGMRPGRELTIEGQPLRGQFVALSPWAFPDPTALRGKPELDALRARCASRQVPGLGPEQLTLEQRRAILADCARSMLPGGANADGYRESVVTADLRLPVRR